MTDLQRLDNEAVKQVLTKLAKKSNARFLQELAGEHEEYLDRVLRKHSAKIARYCWKAGQKWCKWTNDGPVLMPDYTRMYYRKGETEVIVQEFPPQIRLLKFQGSLVNRNDTSEPFLDDSTYNFSLALPYVVFLFKFVEGQFVEVRVAFSDRPLKKLEEKPLRPYLPNIDSNLSVCLGLTFNRAELIPGDLVQQVSYVLSYFWGSVFRDEWAVHYWNLKQHFQMEGDDRMSSLQNWRDAGFKNPLFVIEDVNWPRHDEESFGDMVVRMFDTDKTNMNFQHELCGDLEEELMKDVKDTYAECLKSVEEKLGTPDFSDLAQELLKIIRG